MAFHVASLAMANTVTTSILGIGTELTSGQILNKNAQWISQKMSNLGADGRLQIVVPDDHALILKALQQCADESNMIFVTGGLGPTSDDFTRDVIAQWTGLEMIWDEASWVHLNERLRPRGIPIKEIQRQQCYFPKGAKILINRMGTANGFYFSFQNKDVFVLPGPPREIESIWDDWIAAIVADKCALIDQVIVKSWDTMGFGESQVAEMIDEVLKGCPYERGYRVHVPYVEFKLTYRKSQSAEAQKWCALVDQGLQAITILKDGEDIASLLGEKLSLFSAAQIIDESQGSILLKRIFPHTKNILQQGRLLLSNHKIHPSPELTLQLTCQGNESAIAEISYLGFRESETLHSPYHAQLQIERSHQFFAEKAMVFFAKSLEKAQALSAGDPLA